MRKTLVLYKPVGMTPLSLLNSFRKAFPEYTDASIGYAGRLDPMADGLVLYLVGDENKQREKYLKLDKEYAVEILLGCSTDSYDILGKLTGYCIYDGKEIEPKMDAVVQSFVGKIEQAFPPFSSKPLNGKPLYYWARRGLLDTDDLPKEMRRIYSIELLECTLMDKDILSSTIQEKLSKVEGDFKQKEYLKQWRDFFKIAEQDIYLILKVRVHCSSGTYMRSLANDIGRRLNIGGCALSITRTKIGSYTKPRK